MWSFGTETYFLVKTLPSGDLDAFFSACSIEFNSEESGSGEGQGHHHIITQKA